MNGHHLGFAETVHQLFQEFLIAVADGHPAVFVFIALNFDHCLYEIGWSGRLHESVGELCDTISFDILLDHSGELDDFFTSLLSLVLYLPSEFERLMFLAEYEVLEFFEVELFHVDFLLAGALGMVVLIALRILALHSCTAFVALANKTLIFKATLLDILNPFNTYHSILLLKVTLWYPDCADIVYPNIVTDRNG